MKTLAARIKHARELSGITQAAMGKAFGISREAVSLWEKGKNAPTVDKLGLLAKITGVPAEWLLKGGPLDPLSRRPVHVTEDELTAFVACLKGRKRQKALAMLQLMLAEEPEDSGEKAA